MCTYNGEEFLPDQLNSIAAQTRMPDELVVCDDSSSDGTLKLLRSFAERAPFAVQVIDNARNLGSTKNFEQAISLCEGDVVVLADQDDLWAPRKLAMLESCLVDGLDFVASFSDATIIDGRSHRVPQRLWSSVQFSPDEQRRFSSGLGWAVLIKHPVVTGATLAFRRYLSSYILPIPDGITHDRWTSLLLACKGKVALVSEPLVAYRKHRNQQIGVGAQSMHERFQQARGRGLDFYAQEIDFLRQVCVRLKQHREQVPHAVDAIQEAGRKIAHLENRMRLRRNHIARIPEVCREIINGGYWKYSAGWESVAKDLLLLGAS